MSLELEVEEVPGNEVWKERKWRGGRKSLDK